jgi:ribulose-bisphosphate carboxylase large chain
MESTNQLTLSGDRFTVTYTITSAQQDAENRVEGISREQTVEFPRDLVPDGPIRDEIIGRIESIETIDPSRCRATISYASEIVSAELPQFINVLFGNISIQPGIRIERFDLPETMLQQFRGPRFGQPGWREILNIHHRPLLCTALKPMGLSAESLAEYAHKFALGGIDIIKDDHGLANQTFCTFEERVQRCSDAVASANQETGLNTLYTPNITGPTDKMIARARFAKEHGAGALLISPGISGFDIMRLIADDDSINLPILSHPAFSGSFVTSADNGILHYALYGQLQRLSGADGSIFPSFGGRFAFSVEECQSIVSGCVDSMGPLKPIFASPGGGMNLERIPAMQEVYGAQVIYLIGGGLHRHSKDLVQNARRFVDLVS